MRTFKNTTWHGSETLNLHKIEEKKFENALTKSCDDEILNSLVESDAVVIFTFLFGLR